MQPLRQIAPKISPQLSTVVDGKVSDNAQSNSNRVKDEADGDDHPNSKRQYVVPVDSLIIICVAKILG